ncbi:MAG TPA: chloride channel protein [Pirellulales bacterium]|jgi:CIC family chloride channel protein|nr:chloride channel protein [Pirellulales bacterium]
MNTQATPQGRRIGPLGFFGWSIVIGVVGALGAVIFRGLIACFHNLLFLGQFAVTYDANVHTPPSPWGPLVVLVPVLGAVGVAFLVSHFAAEAKGHGVPEVMDAIYYNRGVIRPIVAVIKSLASALSIGSGGSIGREGPIIQIGASFGSTLGALLRLPAWERITLIAAGAGAGIAATFNTPIGGVLFAVEIMLHEVSARTLIPVTIATVTASYVGRLIFGDHPSFVIPPLATSTARATDVLVLCFYPALGVLTGLLSFAYIRSIYAFEDFFEKRVPGNYYLRHMLGMFIVGLVIYALLLSTGHYYVQGIGYATIQDVLSGKLSWFLLVLGALKLLTTSLTLGSGASGGVFSPALYMGATLGGAYGLIISRIFPGLPVDPVAFAVAGMAGVVGGSTGAALAAVVMIFEMTLDYTVIIPMTITVALSYGVRKLLLRESIYTLKLARRGHDVPDALQANFYHLKKTRDVMDTHFIALPGSGTLDDFVRTAIQQPDVSCFLVNGPQGLIGFLTRESALRPPDADHTLTLADLADRSFVMVKGGTPLLEVMARMQRARVSVALVANDDGKSSESGIQGLVTRQQIASAVIDGMDLFFG